MFKKKDSVIREIDKINWESYLTFSFEGYDEDGVYRKKYVKGYENQNVIQKIFMDREKEKTNVEAQ